MRRRPQEEDKGEKHGLGRQDAFRCRRAGKDGEAASEAANDDIGPAPALEPDRVDDAIDEGAHEGVEGGPAIGRPPGERHGESQERQDGREPGRTGAEAAGGEGPAGGALHGPVQIGLGPLVEGAGACRGEEHRRGKQGDAPGLGQGSGRDGDAAQSAHHDGHPDPQLEDRENIPDERNGGAGHHNPLPYCIGHSSDRYFQLTK